MGPTYPLSDGDNGNNRGGGVAKTVGRERG